MMTAGLVMDIPRNRLGRVESCSAKARAEACQNKGMLRLGHRDLSRKLRTSTWIAGAAWHYPATARPGDFHAQLLRCGPHGPGSSPPPSPPASGAAPGRNGFAAAASPPVGAG